MTFDEWIVQWFDAIAPNKAGIAFRDIIGQDRWETTWAPVRTGWTDVGTPAVTGRFRTVGKLCQFQVRVIPGTTIATTAGTSYIGLPILATMGTALPSGIAGEGSMSNDTTHIWVGGCDIDLVNSRCYVPTQGASGNTFKVFGQYEIG